MPTTDPVTANEGPTTLPAPRFLPLETIPVRLEGKSIASRTRVFGVISNMSETGACIITNTELPKGTEVRVTIGGARTKEMQVPAHVIWCNERLEPVKEIVGYLTGLTFDSDTENSIRTLLASGVFQLVP